MANIQRLTEALNAYTGEQDSLMAFAKVAEEELGENWTNVIYDVITPEDETQKEKLDHVYHYYGATLAWGEVQGYLEQEEPLDLAELSERIPTLEYWLNFFGDQGLKIVNELQDKMRQQALMDEVYKIDNIRKESAKLATSMQSTPAEESSKTPETASESETATTEMDMPTRQTEAMSDMSVADTAPESDEMPMTMADESEIFDMDQMPSEEWEAEEPIEETQTTEASERETIPDSQIETATETKAVSAETNTPISQVEPTEISEPNHQQKAVDEALQSNSYNTENSSSISAQKAVRETESPNEFPAFSQSNNQEENTENVSSDLPSIPTIPTMPTIPQQPEALKKKDGSASETVHTTEEDSSFPSIPAVPTVPFESGADETAEGYGYTGNVNQVEQPTYNESASVENMSQSGQPMNDENGYPYQPQALYNENAYAGNMSQTEQPMYDENGYPYQPQIPYNEGVYAGNMAQTEQPMYDENGYPYQPQAPYNENAYTGNMAQTEQPMYDENGYPYQPQGSYNENAYMGNMAQTEQPMYDENGYPYQPQIPYNEGVYADNTQQPYDENAYAYEATAYDNAHQTDSNEAYQSNYAESGTNYNYEPGQHDEVGYSNANAPVRQAEQRPLTPQMNGVPPTMPGDEHVRVSSRFQPERPETNEQFLARKAFKQLDFVNMVHSWMDARCISLGNIEIYTYKHYGFLIDAMEQTKKDIKEVLSSPAYYPAIEATRPNGLQMLQNSLVALEKDLEIAYDNAPSETTALIKDDVNPDEARRMLGMIDTSNKKEYLGPAPDGFEMLDDPFDDTNKV